jgi:integrase
MSNSRKITLSIVKAIKPGETVWDGEIKGFCIRARKKARVYALKTRINGRVRWFTIGSHGSPWTPETARKEAMRLLAEINQGTDLAAIREKKRHQPTMKDLCERYLREHAREHKKPSSYREDERNIEKHILPLLGRHNVSDVTRADIERFIRNVKDGKTVPKDQPKCGYRGGAVIKGGPYVANRNLSLLSKMFNLAEVWGYRENGSNPTRHVKKYKEKKRERFLSREELARLFGVLSEAEKNGSENIYVIAALKLLILTGARMNEILTLRWEYVDFENGLLRLPDSKTGQKVIFLSPPAIEILEQLPRYENNPHVIIGHKTGMHLVNLRKPWGRIRNAAGINDVRIHDLRHSFASIAASSGMPLPMIGKLLGHSQVSTTQRYAHLADDPLREANNAIGEEIAKVMKDDASSLSGDHDAGTSA